MPLQFEGDHFGLVEAAFATPPEMQWYRDQQIRQRVSLIVAGLGHAGFDGPDQLISQ